MPRAMSLAFVAVSVAVTACGSAGCPDALTDHEFKLVQTRRFELDATLPLDVDDFWPGAQYVARVTALPATVSFVTDGGEVKLGRTLAADDVRLPVPPFDVAVLLAGRSRPAVFTRKDGEVKFLELLDLPKGFDPRERSHRGTLRFRAGGGAGSPRVELSAGIGQADIRFVTEGRENKPYVENGRLFLTFSARSYGSYLGVMSIDPEKPSDLRLEGTIFFDYGDGLLRNDVAADLFHDNDGVWRAYVCNFSTGQDDGAGTSGRRAGGVNVAWSERSPLHGANVMRARSLGLSDMNEDPDGIWDAAAGKWRLLVSAFTPNGIRAAMLESEKWDGPFAPLAGPVDCDSTGTTVFCGADGAKACVFGSSDRACYVRSYPDLKPLGKLAFDRPPWPEKANPPHGRVWPAVARLPDGTWLMVTMDRENFPGIPKPNWTYGTMMIYR